jgi:hypothetical protein
MANFRNEKMNHKTPLKRDSKRNFFQKIICKFKGRKEKAKKPAEKQRAFPLLAKKKYVISFPPVPCLFFKKRHFLQKEDNEYLKKNKQTSIKNIFVVLPTHKS